MEAGVKPGASDKAVAAVQAGGDGCSGERGADEDGEQCLTSGSVLKELLASLRN